MELCVVWSSATIDFFPIAQRQCETSIQAFLSLLVQISIHHIYLAQGCQTGMLCLHNHISCTKYILRIASQGYIYMQLLSK